MIFYSTAIGQLVFVKLLEMFLTKCLGALINIRFSKQAIAFFLRHWVMFSLSHASPCVWAQEMGLSFGAPKQPKTSISWLINGPHESLLPSIPQPTQASPGHLRGLGPLKLVAWLGVK